MRRTAALLGCLGWTMGVAACGEDGDAAERGDLGTAGTADDGGGTVADTTGSVPDPDSTGGPGETDEGEDVDPDDTGGSESGEGQMFDCAPAWTTPWVGSPCASDSDCSYEGGFCINEEQGYPCGTCTLPCADLCPDMDGTPETFCVSGAEVGLDAGGHCLSRCDATLLPGDGCRDGYVCTGKTRYMDEATSASVCLPQLYSDMPRTSCQQTLMDLGAVFTPIEGHVPDSPEGYPNLSCDIDEPIYLHTPVNGIELRYIESAEPNQVFIGCEAAISIVGSAAVAADLGIDEILHIGTYNCRVIAGTSTISQHGLANAIDIGGFTLDTGEEITLIEHWEHGTANPVTEAAQILRDFSDQVWALGLWNVIFTPEHDAAHDNHFHMDLLPGGNTYD